MGSCCVVLAGTSEGLAGPRVLEGACCRCYDMSDLAGSILVEIHHSVEGGDVASVHEPRNKSLVFVIAHLSLTCVYILHVFIVYIFYLLEIPCA